MNPVWLLLALPALWLAAAAFLWLRHGPLLRAAWREPYFLEVPVLIESDDWGPGPAWQAGRLDDLARLLNRHHDALGRAAVITTDMVLSVPDAARLRERGEWQRRFLDADFPALYAAFRRAQAARVLVPQLHAVEHCHAEGMVALAAAGDPRVEALDDDPEKVDWERLDSPLQSHHVDCTVLPSRPLPFAVQQRQVEDAVAHFERLFGYRPRSAVAPCYLWDDTTEDCWAQAGVRYVQTAGYRCPGREADGRYRQDRLLRIGDTGRNGLRYLVRNCMYEPVDGRGVEGCIADARQALAEAAPVVISTHRYNYTRSLPEHQTSLAGLGRILAWLGANARPLRFLSSPELGDAVARQAGERPLQPAPEAPHGPISPPPEALDGSARLAACHARLVRRHPKLRLLLTASGLALLLWPWLAWGRRSLRLRRSQRSASLQAKLAGGVRRQPA
jgi:hypothetical protein